jgi:hypothetical protein
MRTFVLLFVLVMPALGAGGAAWAKAPADIGKPVCTHYDDNAKAVARTAADATVSSAPTTTATASSAAPTSGNATTAQAKSGASGLMHPRSAPRWQTLLPGMFR